MSCSPESRAVGNARRAITALRDAGIDPARVGSMSDDALLRVPGVGRAVLRTLRAIEPGALEATDDVSVGAAAAKAYRDRKRSAGIVELRGCWVPVDRVDDARRAVAELVGGRA